MAAPSLQDGIDEAGSPIKLLWKTDPVQWTPPVVEREYAGWRREQAAWQRAVAIIDLSYHMWDTYIEGPDATRMLRELSANNYEKFAIDQAKQFVPVTAEGLLVGDGILLRRAEQEYVLTGRPTAQMWVAYHGGRGGYDVEVAHDPDCSRDPGHRPRLFRFQIQGPLAAELIESAFGGPIPETPFFHSTHVSLAGRRFRALRHGMAGQAGYEFIGDHADAPVVKEALMRAGEPLGLVHVGALAYPSAQTESGWIPTPIPAIFTAPSLYDYRTWLSLYTPDAQQGIHGSYFSDDVEDYYQSPYELGYGRSISFNHDFLGRDALEKARHDVRRTKVTLVLDPHDVRRVFGDEPEYVLTRARQRVEVGSEVVGMTQFSALNDPAGTILSLAVIGTPHAAPGTEVAVVWGDHPGPGTAPDADLGFPRLRATVAPVPFNEWARANYRRNA
jgi:vanillate/3-O-methylgallate O-demethylase